MLDRYLTSCRWEHNGMRFPLLNCWGLVRLARHELFGLPMLQASDCPADDKRRMTQEALDVIAGLSPCEPRAGAVAFCWRGRLCVHVGLVVESEGRLAVLDIDHGRGACVTPLPDWRRRYLRVSFHAD